TSTAALTSIVTIIFPDPPGLKVPDQECFRDIYTWLPELYGQKVVYGVFYFAICMIIYMNRQEKYRAGNLIISKLPALTR
ncbi:MAG: hypothetical protein PWQ68_2152, partial [Thermoanaerobacteraceae bacterium]|nr:hypothetical protein [Thermoanaerobacteraceae bacterium]